VRSLHSTFKVLKLDDLMKLRMNKMKITETFEMKLAMIKILIFEDFEANKLDDMKLRMKI